MNGINYVIACYLGPRAHIDPIYQLDPWHYLRQHISSLLRLNHNLSQITIVMNADASTPAPGWLPSKIQGAPVVYLQRSNVGMSYGAFAYAFNVYGKAFSHYILTEDDYLFTQDDFDEKLLSMLADVPTCGLLCGAVYDYKDFGPTAAVMVGIAPAKALERTAEINGGELPSDKGNAGYDAGYFGQTQIGPAILRAGYGLCDWLHMYSTAFRSDHGTRLIVRWFGRAFPGAAPDSCEGDLRKPSFIVPVQVLGKFTDINDNTKIRQGKIHQDGSVIMDVD